MITRLALLARVLPGSFRRPAPAHSSIHYTLPHERHFAAAFVLSAAVHAGVFCGFNTPAPKIPEERTEIVVTKPEFRNAVEVVLPPPPPPDPNTPPPPSGPRPREHVDPIAAIRESFTDTGPGGIHIELRRIDNGVPPDLGRNLGKVPLPDEFGRRTPGGEELVPLEKLDTRPEIVRTVEPRYPVELLHNASGGTVVVRFIVTRNGDVGEVTVLSASHPDFAAAAVEAVRKWKFHAGRKNNRRVDTRMEMPLKFAVTEDL